MSKYQKNFLTKVIARIDFLSPLITLRTTLPIKLGNICTSYFPIPEPKEMTLHEFSFSLKKDDVSKGQESTMQHWHFFGKERNKHLSINDTAMFIEFMVYQSWDDFCTHFFAISDALYSNFPELQVKRLGLRYINNIEIPGPNKFYWGSHLNRNLLHTFAIPDDKSKIIRAFHNLELNLGDFRIRFQYGMDNPDYPASIVKKIFVLDYDSYINGSLTSDEIHQTLPKLHSEIEHLFEKSITDKLRGIMNE